MNKTVIRTLERNHTPNSNKSWHCPKGQYNLNVNKYHTIKDNENHTIKDNENHTIKGNENHKIKGSENHKINKR